ncbi:uncharacterized protein LOC143872331 [Tasmannia lanceolata]|uniref:uncharacterized protein LOC143872331 n=1 Tax=Tasmannia lanceolata TaxID=3420 RepID=UPI004063B5E8
MLQWMGGSRRKVMISRKSTQKRQKQYFEQRKRQQQTFGLENYTDGRNKHPQYHEERRSLDIISLMNLATIAQERNSGLTTNAKESSEANNSHVNYHGSIASPSCLVNGTIPGSSTYLSEAKSRSACYKAETISPMKVSTAIGSVNVPPTHNHSSQMKGENADEWKASSENKFSVFDLLGDDGFHGCSEGRPVQEAHVAFSVEGLGKMGMETPVHSPRQPERVFFNDRSSLPKAARRPDSSKNYKCTIDNLDVEVNRIIRDVDVSLGSSASELPFNAKGIMNDLGNSKSRMLSAKGCKPLDTHEYLVDNFLSDREEENLCSNTEEKIERTWNDRLGFLDENFLDDRKYGVAWKNHPFQMECDSTNFLGSRKREISDYSYEEPCLVGKRDRENARKEFSTSVCSPDLWRAESPLPYFKHSRSLKDYNFTALDEERYPAVCESWDFKNVTNQPSWSIFMTDNERESMSLLSEESCSSIAVGSEQAKNSASSLIKIKSSKKGHASEFKGISKNNVKIPYAEKTGYANLDEVHQEKNLKGAGNYKTFPNSYRSKTFHSSNEHSDVQRTSESLENLLFDDGYTSVDMGSAHSSPFHKSSMGTDNSLFDCKFWSKEEPFGTFPIPKFYPDMEPSFKRSKSNVPVDHTPTVNSFFEKDELEQPFDFAHSCDSHIFSNTRSKPQKPDRQMSSKKEGQSPHSSSHGDFERNIEIRDLSRLHNLANADEDELGFHFTGSREVMKEPEKEVSIENSNLLSGNGKSADGTDYKDSCSEQEEAKKEETPDVSESLKMGNSPECAEETQSDTKAIPANLESCISNKRHDIDAGGLVQSQSGNKDAEGESEHDTTGKENFGFERIKIGSKGCRDVDQSYQVMLESYVLHLLCVQKVLKEEKKHDNIKKV